MPWCGPTEARPFPTLGWYVLGWARDNLIVPDGPGAGDPLTFTREQARFLLSYYALDPRATGPAIRGGQLHNARTVRRAVLSRPKGWGKSPLVAAMCIIEAVADVVFDGWDDDGQPVGRPWHSLGFKPRSQIIAVSEDQTANTWEPVLEMCREGPIARNYQIEALDTFVSVPKGRIDYATSAARSREGFRPIFAAMDQTESWVPSIGGPRLAGAIRRNLSKTQGSSVETPNAFVPGENSVAEASHSAWIDQVAGKLHSGDSGIMVDHREAPQDLNIADPVALRAGLEYAYGDSVWVHLGRIMADFYDPSSTVSDSRRFFLNQIWSAEDAWLQHFEWYARAATYCTPELDEDGDLLEIDGEPWEPPDGQTMPVRDGDTITLGFDGSRQRSHVTTDATALIGCRLSDGHVFELRVWEQPDGPAGNDWRVPTEEVDAEVAAAFERFNVVGFYADPAKWETYVARWESKYGKRLKVGASKANPIEWWMVGGRSALIVRALEQFHSAVVDGELSHDNSPTLGRHITNARRMSTRSGVQIRKETPDSERKIDAAVAAVLAWQARIDAIAAGVDSAPADTGWVPVRVR